MRRMLALFALSFLGLPLLLSAGTVEVGASSLQQVQARPDLMQNALFTSLGAESAASAASLKDHQVVRWRQVGIRSDLLTSSARLSPDQLSEQQDILLNLFDGTEFVAEPTQVEQNAHGVKWVGRLRGINLSQVIFAISGDEVFGSISMPGRRFQLRSVGNGVHKLQEINTRLFSANRPSTDPLPPGVVAQKSGPYSTITTIALPDGTLVDALTIKGPSKPPPGFEDEQQAVTLPEPNSVAGTHSLEVPAYRWVFGCSAVSAAMIAAYYDRNGYPNIYTGPTNGGVMPMDSRSWPEWTDVTGTSYPSVPLAASQKGVDGRTTRGSIDDYWVQDGSTASDPYITGDWTQHTWGDAIGDYMYTSQSKYNNPDGYTTFYNYTSGSSQLTCGTMLALGYDGTLGRFAFDDDRGYGSIGCYNQKTDNQVAGGFSFANFKAEIDAGHPVMLNLDGHTIVGVGYDDFTNTAKVHNTWDYGTWDMTWGTDFSGMELQSVSIVTPPPNIYVTVPAAGASWTVGSTQIVSWFAPSSITAVDIWLWNNGNLTQLANNVPNTGIGIQSITVPNSQGTNCLVYVYDHSDHTVSGVNPGAFTIVGGSPLPTAATLISPTGSVTTTTPTYSWNAVSNSTWYCLWVNDSTGVKIQIWYTAAQAGCSSGTGTCSVTPSVTLAPGAVQWWIQTWNSSGYGPWSDGMAFTVTGGTPGQATLSAPSGSISTTTPTYSWNAVSNSTWYYLWVNDSTGIKIQIWYTAAQAGCASGTGTCSVTPNTALTPGWYIWWIQTWNSSGYGPWSDGMAFTVTGGTLPGQATLIAPSGSISTATPTYSWNAVTNSTWYFLWVNDSTGTKIATWYTAAQAGCASGTGICSMTPSVTLASGAAQWWIQTWNSSGYGPWSAGMGFIVP